MQSDWKELTIDQLKSDKKNAIAMGPFGSRIKAENFVDEGIPVIKGTNLNGDFINENKYDYLTEKKADELKTSNAFPLDIVITHRGTIGQVGLIPKDSKYSRYVVSQSQLKVTLDQAKMNPYYLYYFFKSRLGQHRLLMNSSQVGVPAIAQASTSVKKILVPHPDLKNQDKIVKILLTLDDKIELNRKMNQTLEEMVQALFKSWFIEEVGDEWEECKLSDVLEIKYGKDHKKLADGNIPVYGSGGVMRYADNFLYDKESILIPRKGTLTNLFYIDEPFWTVDTIFWSKINTEKVSGKFLFSFLKTIDLSNLNVGSAVPSLTTKVLNEIKIAIPTIDEQKEFNEYADNAWEKMRSNKKQNKTLEEMRDTLLPKLLSGELDVSKMGIN